MKTLKNLFLGIGIGICSTIGIDYLLNGNQKISNIGQFGESLDGVESDTYILEKGIGKFRSQTIYFPTVLKEKNIKDYSAPKILKMQFKTGNIPLDLDFLINNTKHYIELNKENASQAEYTYYRLKK